jgi:hypothetical protein
MEMWPPSGTPTDLQSSDPHGQPPFTTGPFEPGELPCNIQGGEVGEVNADFDKGGDDGYDAGDFGDIAPNIHV